MAISPEYVGLLQIGIRSSSEWTEAWDRINDYLDALKAPDSVDRDLILLSSFERAIARKRREPFTPATELAFEETQKTLDHALRHLVDQSVPEDRRLVEQRVRLYLTENVDGSLLGRTEELSEEVLQALREVKLQAAPNLQVASITPRPRLNSRSVGSVCIATLNNVSPGTNMITRSGVGWKCCQYVLLPSRTT